MNASHTGHKALRRLPQSTCRFRCHNKEEAEERSGKCIDLKKKKTSMKRCRGERVKEKKISREQAVGCSELQGPIKK